MSEAPASRPFDPAAIRAILFDLDGTLIDTERAAAISLAACFSEWGIELHPDDAQFITGRTWAKAFEYLFGKYEVPVPAPHAKREILRRYRESVESNPIFVPGAAAAIEALAVDFRLALVSGSFRHEIIWALEKLGVLPYFPVILGAEDYPNSKPAPDGFRKAMDLLGVKPEECLVFEDSEAGIQSALAAGAWVTVIESTNHFRQATSEAHWRIHDLVDVKPAWVRGLSSPESK